MIPGLCAQSRILNNNELKALIWPPKEVPQYYAVTSTFRPAGVGWEFWKVFCDWTQVAGVAEDRIFPAANDLVVDTVSMTQDIHVRNTLAFGDTDGVCRTLSFPPAEDDSVHPGVAWDGGGRRGWRITVLAGNPGDNKSLRDSPRPRGRFLLEPWTAFLYIP